MPITTFYILTVPLSASWPDNFNLPYLASHWLLWVSSLVIYGPPTLFGGFTWLWNAYLVGGYVAWTQYLVVWGGSILSLINFFVMLAGCITYEIDPTINPNDTILLPYAEFGLFVILLAGSYTGYWLLNDYFLEYYVIEEINHKKTPTEAEVKVDDESNVEVVVTL